MMKHETPKPFHNLMKRKTVSFQVEILTFVYETHDCEGIKELLEIMVSIVNGYTRPLKEEHREYLLGVLMPLHSVPSVHEFHVELSDCVMQFLDNDPTLCVPGTIFFFFFSFW